MKKNHVWVVEIDEFKHKWLNAWIPCLSQVSDTKAGAKRIMDNFKGYSPSYYRYRVRKYEACDER